MILCFIFYLMSTVYGITNFSTLLIKSINFVKIVLVSNVKCYDSSNTCSNKNIVRIVLWQTCMISLFPYYSGVRCIWLLFYLLISIVDKYYSWFFVQSWCYIINFVLLNVWINTVLNILLIVSKLVNFLVFGILNKSFFYTIKSLSFYLSNVCNYYHLSL